MKKSVWRRILIVAAGPIFNLILPVVVFTSLLMAGEPQPAAVVGSVEWDSPAKEAGLEPSDLLLSMDDQEFGSWIHFIDYLKDTKSGEHRIRYKRQNEILEKSITIHDDKPLGIGYRRPNTEIGIDDPSSPAGKAGLRNFDQIQKIDGVVVDDFVVLQDNLKSKSRVEVVFRRGEETLKTTMEIDDSWVPKVSYEDVGLDSRWGILSATLFIDDVSDTVGDDGGLMGCTSAPPPPSPAIVEGILPGDRLVKINDELIREWGDIPTAVSAVMEGEGESATAPPIMVSLMREGELYSLEIQPRVIQDTDMMGRYRYRPILGIRRGGDYVDGPTTRVYYPFVDAFDRSVRETIFISTFIVEQLGKLITGEAAVEKSLGGPVEIVVQAEKAAQKGFFEWARLMALMSISLGIINLVPVPVLDGGQLLFFFIEAVRGKPVSPKMREYAMQIGVLFMAVLFLFVFFFDISRWLGG